MWMEREQKRREVAHKQAEIKKIVDEHEKKRLAEASAALTNTRVLPDSGTHANLSCLTEGDERERFVLSG